jgi:hypothetical protein
MEDIDMSRPGNELFTETNTYAESYDDPLNTGVQQSGAADQGHSQQKNFESLRVEVSKMQAERDYWRGQADAYAKIPTRQPEETKADAFSALDLEDSSDVRKAFDAMRQENTRLREEMKDALTAIETKTQRQDWNAMVTQHVPKLTSQNPIFAEMIQRASNPYEAAYLLAELNSKASSPAQPPGYGQRAVSNAQKPQTLNTVGGSGQLSAADYYASMSDADFEKIATKNLANV